MAERRKIIIPTGANPDGPLPTPHFDTEATLTARPVVPLAEQDMSRPSYGDYAGQVRKPFWKRPAILALIVLAAVGVGVAAGLAIGIYRNRAAATTPVATQPSPTVENGNVGQTIEPTPTPQAERASVPEKPVEKPAEPKNDAGEHTARREQKDADEVTPPPPPVARDKKSAKKDEDDEKVLEDRQAERERRREKRREQRG